jgi:DNA-binding transcriptional MerR regulator
MRFYEVKAVLSPRRDGNRRYYGPDQVAVMQRVVHWRTMGLSVDTMRRVLKGELAEELAIRARREAIVTDLARLGNSLALVSETLRRRERAA